MTEASEELVPKTGEMSSLRYFELKLNKLIYSKYCLNPITSRLSLLLHKSRTSVNNNDNLRV